MDAARKGTPCIVAAHCGYGSLGWADGNDAAAVREIYQRANAEKAGTVLMSINGHLHTDHQGWRDGVFYLDMNTTRNNWWQDTSVPHYTSDMTYSFEEYDEEGNLLSVTDKPLSSLGMAGNTWFSADPLSCVITISTSGVVVIDGANSDWAYGVAPTLPETATGVRCEVTSGTFIACEVYGHAEKTVADDDTHYTVCGSPLCQYTSAHTEHAYTCHTVAEEHLAHAADCTHPATYYYSCSCGKNGGETFTEGDPLGHVFGEWVIVTAPTASTAGERKHTCSRCGADEKETIPAEDPAPAPSGGCAGCASALSTSSAIGAALAVAAAGVALHARKKKGQE